LPVTTPIKEKKGGKTERTREGGINPAGARNEADSGGGWGGDGSEGSGGGKEG